ncbi:hypothetical protein G5S34_04645 [Herbaspirillum frisingense]|uniref:SDR family oxidoreductase n=1 Tax=Herbaspirillum frisingense TaxID=92645 RepID=UPI0015FF6000|nr:SDR family oxidoreductase [Herbaspirillum frisingense]QNB06127.1 hypothetical protein G5S34_04645 [Herbaspirillum frisingense]
MNETHQDGAGDHDDLILFARATSFPGAAVVVDLMQQGQGERLLLMVRGAGVEQVLARVRGKLHCMGAEPTMLARLKPSRILLASLEGIEAILPAALGWRVWGAIQSATQASFCNHSGLEQLNVYAGVALAQLLQRRGRLRRVLYVGTAMACGIGQGPDARIVEQPEPALTERAHLVPYTRSNALCDLLPRKLRPSLPLVVVRPSIIVCHTRLGCIHSSSIYRFFALSHAWRKHGAAGAED